MNPLCLIGLILLLVCPTSLLARPVEVLVYPEGATITEQRSAAVVAGAVTLTLPEAADPESLQLATVGGKAAISALRYESTLAPAGDYQALRDAIAATQERLQAVEDTLQARLRALELWHAPLGEQFQTAGEVQKLADLLLANSEKLYQDRSRLEKEKKKIEKDLHELEQKLADATSRQHRSWSVHLTLAGAGTTEVLRYSYRVRNADWQPLYTLDARPGARQIEWDWRAQVRQSTAVDWKDVRLLLATAEPVVTLTPPALQLWFIRPANDYPLPAPRLMSKAAMPESLAQDFAAAAPAPVRQAGTLFDIYDLGQQTLLAGASYQLKIRDGVWPAQFAYLVRPFESPQAFLSAKLEFDTLLPMPSGPASILVEGVFVGHREFALLAKKLDLPFGNDPQIQVKVTPTREADEGGVFSRTKSQTWQWAVAVTNNKPIAVRVRVEDSPPQVEDKRIKLTATSTANGSQEDGPATWELELQPGAQQTIHYGYTIEYPAEMQVELGR
ncbi:mucoidy inhibitor MuiA family protein [Desulfuromonas carbonis]|uniref:DUF4139 domain-containing protein n=1 Tax=Desulfuromonas sp. DDH964 TaxID=1823759 RepID=UPI00078D386A|nr:DUF4139 domain-containing protein [Desulfuromonas sp. DDH964]AMV73695.1 hypothetical protein DBW_3397 [Desulfuromonas sp. DDH964]